MNLGLVTSYIIGGIILLSILAMNISLSTSSTEITLTQMTREKVASVSELIAHDIQKMGYNRENKTDPILVKALPHKIEFNSNINNSTDNSVETVSWEFHKLESLEIPSTENPNDYILLRTVKDATGSIIDETPVKLGVTNFEILYYNSYGEPTENYLSDPNANINSIKQMYIKLSLESGDKIYYNAGNEGRYVKSVWEKRFSPPNLEDNNL